MAAQDDAIPPIPAAPDGVNGASGVPPVEPAPAAATPVEAAPVVPPVGGSGTIPASAMPPIDARANPYAAPSNPYANAAAQPAYAQPAYGQPGSAQPYTGTYAPTPPQGLSIASLICGIGGLLFTFVGFGFLPALAAVILGHIAQKRQPYAKGMWVTGLITGYIGISINSIIGLVFFLALLLPLFVIGSAGTFG